jgi:hypothetical protein
MAYASLQAENRVINGFSFYIYSGLRVRTIFRSSFCQTLFAHIYASTAGCCSHFSPFFVFQGYPFYRLSRQPRIGLAIMAASTAAGLGITVVFEDIHTYILSITSAVLLWSILYSWAFAYPISRKYGQPRRGLVTLPIIILISSVWSNFLSMFLSVPEVVWLNLYLLLPRYTVLGGLTQSNSSP